MSDHVVICRTCRTHNGRNPKIWRWLCEDCAEECADNHRRDTGHHVDLSITMFDELPQRLRRRR